MDLGPLQDLVSGGDFIARLVNGIKTLVSLAPWLLSGVLVYVVVGGENGIALVYKLRELLRGAKAVSTENNARLDTIEKKVDALIESLKPKV